MEIDDGGHIAGRPEIDVDVDFAAMTFNEAVPRWKNLRLRRWNLKPRTFESDVSHLEALAQFFGPTRLDRITPGNLWEYQIARKANRILIEREDGIEEIKPWKRRPGNKLINGELCTLRQMLTVVGLWDRLQPLYCPLPVGKWSPREDHILTEEEEMLFFRRASQCPEIMLAYCVAAITNNTTASGCELRGLRLGNIFLRVPQLAQNGVNQDPSEFYIPGDAVKNDDRPRKIPLNDTARWAMEWCYARALRLGCTRPEHFLFPFRIARNRYDPNRRASRWFLRNNWAKLRKVTEFPNVHPHDFRHLCITRMLEHDVDGETVRSIAGHVSREMMEYYSHIRRRKKYAALMSIDDGVKKPPVREMHTNQKKYLIG